MLLLSDLMTNSLDEGYARAAARRAEQGVLQSSRGLAAVVLAFALVGLLLAAAATQVRSSAPAAARERAALAERIREQTERVDAMHERADALRAEVRKAQSSALELTDAGSTESDRLIELELISGVLAAEGEGVKVVVDDAQPKDPALASGEPNSRVLDADLQRLVNGLWAAGAEAISINGQRITALTAIRSAGDAILVSYRPLSPPYTVLAIGDSEQLEVDFVDGPGGRWFRLLEDNYGIAFDVSRQQELRLPGASDVALRYADERGDS
ncbi:MAG: DUF881 domain-containing protein [Acidimicrobiia bacterium]